MFRIQNAAFLLLSLSSAFANAQTRQLPSNLGFKPTGLRLECDDGQDAFVFLDAKNDFAPVTWSRKQHGQYSKPMPLTLSKRVDMELPGGWYSRNATAQTTLGTVRFELGLFIHMSYADVVPSPPPSYGLKVKIYEAGSSVPREILEIRCLTKR